MTTEPGSAIAKTRRRTRRALAALGALVLAYAAASWVATSWLLHPEKSPPPPAIEGAERLRELARTTDGFVVAGDVLTPRSTSPRGVVVLFHGLRRRRLVGRQPFLRNAGFASIAVDLRAHGLSDGGRTSFGFAEARDVEATVHEARRRHPTLPVFAWGQSLGGAAICFASESVARDLQGVILESVYSRIDLAFRRRLDLRGVPDALKWLGAGPYHLAAWRLGVAPEDLRPERSVRGFRDTPLLIMTGSDDQRAPPSDLDRLARTVPTAERFILPGAHHRNVWSADDGRYRRKVLEFLDRATSISKGK